MVEKRKGTTCSTETGRWSGDKKEPWPSMARSCLVPMTRKSDIGRIVPVCRLTKELVMKLVW
eukprot:3590676-Prorocentrum_lima.AAC.1